MARFRLTPFALALLAGTALQTAGSLAPAPFGRAVAPPAAAQGAPVVLENLVLDLGPVRYVIPRLEASGTNLTSAELADIVDGKSGRSLTERMARLTAASIVAPEVRVEQTAGDVTTKGVYRDVRLSDIASGKVAKMTIAGVSLDIAGPNNVAMTGSMGAMTATNIDALGVAKMVIEARRSPNEPLTVLYESFTLDGYKFGDGKTIDVSIGKMTGRDIKGRPGSKPFFEIIKTLPQTKPGEQPTPEEMRQLVTFLVDVFDCFDMGLVEINDLAFTANSGGPKPAQGKMARIVMREFGAGRLGEISYEGLDVSAPDGTFKLGQFALRGLDFSATLKAAQKGAALGAFEAVPPREYIPTLAGLVVAGFEFDVPDAGRRGNADGGARNRMSLGKFEIGAKNYIFGIPTALTAQVDKFVFPLPPNDPKLRDLVALGYSTLDMSTKLDLAWNEGARELALNEYSANIAGMGAAKISGVFGNVTRDVFASGDLAVVQAALLGAVIKSATLRVDNAGIYEKALAAQARQERKSPEDIRRTLVQGAAIGIPSIFNNDPKARDLANAISKFLANAKNLTIEAVAPQGLGAGDLGLMNDPAALIKRLEIKASAND